MPYTGPGSSAQQFQDVLDPLNPPSGALPMDALIFNQMGAGIETAQSGIDTVRQMIFGGTGSPEGVLAAPVGALYERADGVADTALYVKVAGTGNTGWSAYTAPGAGDYFTNDHVSLFGLPHGSGLGGNGSYRTTTVFGDASNHPPNVILSAAPNRVQWVTDVSRSGNGSLRFETRHLDYGGTANNRNQIENSAITTGSTSNRVDGRLWPGDDVYLAFSVFFPTGQSIVLSGTAPLFEVLYQLFGATGDNTITGGSPPFALELQNTTMGSPSGADFSITIRGGDKASSGATAPVQHFTRILPATLGVWHDFLIRYRMGTSSSDTSGRVQVYHRLAGSGFIDTPVYDYTGVNVLSINGTQLGVEHSYGWYRNDRPDTQVVYWGPVFCRPRRSNAMEVWSAIPVVTGPATWIAALTADLPAGWWKLDETSGTTAADATANADTGTYQNAPTLNQTGAGAGTATGITLNGTNQYVAIPHSTSLDVADNFSLEAWIKLTGTGTYAILSHGWDGSTHVPELEIVNGNLRLVYPQINTLCSSTGAALNDGAWHHVVATKAGAAIHLYQDGVDVSGSSINVTAAGGSAKGWTIGVRDQNGSFIQYLPGSVDEVACYPYALPLQQVLMHYYNAGR